jgi:rhodanese-related sulfurtransferase
MPIPDHVIVYPGHGAGSACGKMMSKETFDTLGNQKRVNYALNPNLSRDEFVKQLLTGLTPPPYYFPKNVLMNIQGYESIEDVMAKGLQALSPAAFEAAANETGALVLDTRKANDFAKGFVPNSINIGIDGGFAVWVGTLVTDIKHPLLIVADEGRVEEVVTRLARVGYDNTIGYLKGGFSAWQAEGKEVDTIQTIEADELAAVIQTDPNAVILDVRKKSEYDSEHIEGVENAPLDYINESMLKVHKDKTTYVHCAGGYRSMVFISVLKARGFSRLVNVNGGFAAIKQAGSFKITDYVCPTTLL